MSLFTTIREKVSKLSVGFLVGLILAAAVALAGLIYGIYYAVWKSKHNEVAKNNINKHKSTRKTVLTTASTSLQPVNAQDTLGMFSEINGNLQISVFNSSLPQDCINEAFQWYTFINYNNPSDTSQLNSNLNSTYVIQLINIEWPCDTVLYLTYDSTNPQNTNYGVTNDVTKALIWTVMYYEGQGNWPMANPIFYDSSNYNICLEGYVQSYTNPQTYVITANGLTPGQVKTIDNPSLLSFMKLG